MNYNKDQLVRMAINTQVDHPRMKGYWGGFDGRARMTVGTGGITYSHAIGDCCMGIAGDHVEPGISMANRNDGENNAVQFLACVGNPVYCISGPAKGAVGMVTGTHGGVDHTMAWFKPEDLEKMLGTEQFLIKAYGQGLKLLDHPDVFFMNIDPTFLEKMDLKKEDEDLVFPVSAIIPSELMGSGLGTSTMMQGDYDIMTQDKEANKLYGIDKLRFGDFVAILDQDATYGPHYKKGAITIGVIVHSDSFTSGHGPGVTVIATSEKGKIKPVLDAESNLKKWM